MSPTKPKSILGCPFGVPKEFLPVLEEFSVKDLDTASSYPGSEKNIGEAGLASKFLIHTKALGWAPGLCEYEKVLEANAQSLELLKTDSVETYFLHTPDTATPIVETLEAIQKLFLEGKFKKFGISNFLPSQVTEVHSICTDKGYILPTVYEGHYNPIGRHAETELFPLLRKLNMSYYVYGALAGGFLVKSPSFFTGSNTDNTVRWDKSNSLGQFYNALYNRPKLLEILDKWETISNESGVSKADLSYRWVAYNSAIDGAKGDGILLGASNAEQLRDTLRGLEDGPLDGWVVDRIDQIWEKVKDEAILDNFNKDTKG